MDRSAERPSLRCKSPYESRERLVRKFRRPRESRLLGVHCQSEPLLRNADLSRTGIVFVPSVALPPGLAAPVVSSAIPLSAPTAFEIPLRYSSADAEADFRNTSASAPTIGRDEGGEVYVLLSASVISH